MVQVEQPHKTHVRLSLLQKIRLLVAGAVPTSRRSRHGWSGSLQFYAFRCPVHGIVENYPQGYNEALRCPICEKYPPKIEPRYRNQRLKSLIP
jgi:hypothetical protein